MTRSCQFTLFLLAVLLTLTGCYIRTELKVTNKTGQPIQFYTDHTKKTAQIPVGGTSIVPHTAGKIRVTTGQGSVWQYEGLDIPDLMPEVTRAYKRLTLPLTIHTSGAIVLPSGKKIEPLRN